MSFSLMHHVRTEALRELESAILAQKSGRKRTTTMLPHVRTQESAFPPELCVLAQTPRQAAIARKAGVERIYVRGNTLAEGTWGKDVIPYLSEIARSVDAHLLEELSSSYSEFVCANVSEIMLAQNVSAQFEIGPEIPVLNSQSIACLAHEGASCVWLSPELSLDEIRELKGKSQTRLGIVVYGRQRVMTSEHCVLQAMNKCIHDCANCKLRTREFYLRNIDGDMLPVRSDYLGRSRIYAAHVLDIVPELPELYTAGVSRFVLDATLLSEHELEYALSKLNRALDALTSGLRPSIKRQQGAHSGHLFAPGG